MLYTHTQYYAPNRPLKMYTRTLRNSVVVRMRIVNARETFLASKRDERLTIIIIIREVVV